MKLKIFLLFALAFCAFGANAQSGTFIWSNGAPTAAPPASGAQFAVDRLTFDWYEWTGISWFSSGERVQKILGCVTPTYTPAKNFSTVVINDCDSLYHYRSGAWRHLNPGGIVSVASVADSAAFRAYRGTADVVIMRDTARGGEFAKCVPCGTADQYMIFSDANNVKYRRINYDRILESWWGKFGHVSLQRAINYVAQKGSSTVGVLTHNQEITLKDSVLVWDGVQIHGISPPLIPGTHPLDAPAKNVITLNLNNPNKAAIVWNRNGRGYSDATLIKNVSIVAISPCRAALVVNEPNGGNISDIVISGGGEDIANRKITNGIEVSASVYSNWNNIDVIGAKTGIKETSAAFSGGTLTITGTSKIRRCVTGIDMAFGGTITGTGLFMENIDTTGIRCNTLFWSGAYTENVPMAANGTVIKTLSSDAVINVQNVTFNGGANCITGDCAAFDGGARHVILLNNTYYNINKIVRSPNAPASGVVGGGLWYNVATRTQNLYGNNKWTCFAISQYSGGTPDTVASWYTGEHRFKILRDKDDATGNGGDVLQSNGDKTMSWGKVPLSSLSGNGVTEGQYIIYDGESWIPTNPPSSIPPGTTGQLVRYNSPTSVTGEPNLFWDAAQVRFGIGTTSPTRRLTVQDPANAYLQVRGENNGGIELYVSNAAPNAAWDSYASRGNLTTPTATNAGNTLGQFRFFGHTGSAYRQAANIRIVNTVNSSPSNGVPTDMIFGVTRTGFGGATDRLWLKNRGYFSIGTDTPSGYLTVKSDDSGVPNVRLISSAGDSTGIYVRSTTPEAAQAAPPGSLSVLTDGSLFSKLTGTGNTGWGEIFNTKKSYSATDGQVLKWNGTTLTWVPANDAGGGTTYTAGTGIDITGPVISNTGDLSNTNEIQRLDTLSVSGNTLRVSLLNDGVPASTVTLPSATAGGANTQIQYNDSGTFGGSSNLVWDNILKRLTITGLGVQGSANTVGSFRVLNSASEQVFFARDNFGFEAGRSLFYTETGNNSTTGTSTLSSTKQVLTFGAGNTNVNMSNGSIINLVSNNNTVLRGFPSATNCVTIGSADNPSYTLDVRGSSGNLGVRGRAIIGATGSAPDASAILEVASTIGGFKPPSMTTTQRNAIASPAAGLELYNTTAGRKQVNTGQWETVLSGIQYTPTGSADPAGVVGSTAWDDNFFYIKTASGWRRSTLSTF